MHARSSHVPAPFTPIAANTPNPTLHVQASQFIYTGTGFSAADGTRLTNPGNGAPIFLGGKGSPSIVNPAVPAACSASGTVVLSSSAALGQPTSMVSASGSHKLLLSKSGQLAVYTEASQLVQSVAAPTASCSAAFQLVLQANGNLVLQDARGEAYWNSNSACLGKPGCYNVLLGPDGVLTVRDSTGAVVWASNGAAGAALKPVASTNARPTASAASSASSSAVPGRLLQLLSTGNAHVSCIQQAPSKGAATSLASREGKYLLSFSSQGLLQLANARSQAVVWSPHGVLNPKAKADSSRLCLAPNGTLLLQGGQPAAALWQSAPPSAGASRTAATPAASRTFLAVISSDGQLAVLDSQCAQVYPSNNKGAALYPAKSRAPQPRKPQRSSTAKPPPKQATVKSRLPSPFPSRLKRSAAAAGFEATLAALPRQQSTAVTLQAGAKASAPNPKSIVPDIDSGCPANARLAASVGIICGGSNLCGQDGPCAAMVCCTNGLRCRRRNAYTWMCLL
jgi:hypothetical protein